MKNSIIKSDDLLKISYSWKTKVWNTIQIEAENTPLVMQEDSEFEFITEHFYGYTKNENKTSEYEALHPQWDFYKIKNYEVSLDFAENYGEDFSLLNDQKPISVMLAEGSLVMVKTKNLV